MDKSTILIDEEIDTSTASKRSCGDFSHCLRKAASGEAISLSRKGENQYVECKNPKLALIMSGTFAQIQGFIKNAEDGLYSRSLFYSFGAGIQWQSVYPCPTCINLSDLYLNSGQEFYSLYKFLKSWPDEVKLSAKQWEQLNMFGELQLHQLYNFHGEETSALAKRHTLMVFKICMVLSGVRKFESENNNAAIYCTDIDFDLRLCLVRISLKSSLSIIKQLPKATSSQVLDLKRTFLEQLPENFTRKQYQDLGVKLKIAILLLIDE